MASSIELNRPGFQSGLESLNTKPQEINEIAAHFELDAEEKNQLILAIETIKQPDDEISPMGKFSAAIKAIRKGYNALPASMRSRIEAYFKIEAFLKIVDTYTGTIDAAVKSTVERFMGRAEFPNTAWWVYKTFMAFVF